ncbi:NUDIX hydrolase [Candidatus Uabimicrobium sp. HlEnr_7]|uniref:NUDIX hydrolase n=1 Tax=Candidatus Uabimicrobium helgolandensis TaxID=3095367 RepID=UPI003558B6AC
MTVKRASVVCIRDNKILGFYGKEPKTEKLFFFLPGGKLDPNESPVDCAIRETLEETGFKVGVKTETEQIVDYSLEWDGQQFPCCTHFYVAQLIGNERSQVDDADYHRGMCWLEVENLHEALSYNKELQQFVTRFVAEYF